MLSIGIVFTSCKKDKNEKVNGFSLNGKTYTTTHGYIQSQSYPPSSSIHYVYLCSDGLTMVSNTGASGTGDYLMLSFVSSSPDKLIAGEYTFPQTLYAYFWIGVSPTSGVSEEYGLNAAGKSTVTVNVNGDTYEIDYSIAIASDKTITGYYKGTLEAATGIH